MANAQHANVLGPCHVPVEREKPIFAPCDDVLAELGIHEPTDPRMSCEDRDRLADRSNVGPRSIRIVCVEVADALEIFKRGWRDDYLRHFLGFGFRAAVPLMRAVRYSNTSSAS